MELRALVIAALVAGGSVCHAQDLKGARSAIERMLDAPKVASVESAAFDKDLADFVEGSPSLSRSAAAKQWVALLVRAFARTKETPMSYGGSESGLVGQVMTALPSPETWILIRDELKSVPPESIGERQRPALDLLMALLVSDRATQTTIIESMIKDIDPENEETFYSGMSAVMLYKEWAGYVREKAHVKRALILTYSSAYLSESYISPLVLILDPADREEVAKKFFEKAEYISIPEGVRPEMREFFLAMAVKYGKENEEAVWQTLAAFGTRADFEAYGRKNGKFVSLITDRTLDKASEAILEESNYAGDALSYYVINLILDGLGVEAEKILINNTAHFSGSFEYRIGIETIRSLDMLERLATTFSNVLLQRPNAGYWSSFTTFAPRAARGDLLVSTAEKALASGTLTPKMRMEVNSALAMGYLAVDRTDEAIALLLAATQSLGPVDDSSFSSAYLLGTRLLSLGKLLKRDDLIDAGLAAFESMPLSYRSFAGDVATMALLEGGKFAEAEERLVKSLVDMMKTEEARMGFVDAEDLLKSLLTVYLTAKKYDDVLYLLQNAPMWPWPDLSGALKSAPEVAIAAAVALKETGRRAEALKITEQLMHTAPGNDRVYELYDTLAGDKLIAGLDALFALDQFEERPLIWKAKALLDRGQLAEAEAVAKQAISIDPSDGEQGKGDRMRVYAILSEVLRKQGQAQQADVYAGAVRAIRISEDADDYYAAGMTQRAIAMYEQALTIFADAYCIQSRLAVQLLASGDPDGAAVHFRKAFELMPDSFGRIESHCFGCEGVFDSPQAQDIALTVLRQLLSERPDKPQIPYLLGYLLTSRGQYANAIPYYEDAVRLDPKYLNAWVALASAYEIVGTAPEAVQKAALAIARLDPLGRHSSQSAYANGVTDFAQLWKIGNDNFRKAPKTGGALFELTAAKGRAEKGPEAAGYRGRDVFSMSEAATGPASFLLTNKLLQIVNSMIIGG